MRLLWGIKLPILIFIQLLCLSKLYAEALFTLKGSLGRSQQLGCSIVKYPCRMQWPCRLNCYKLKDPGALSLILCGIAAKVDGNNDIPTLTPVQEAQVNRQGERRAAAATVGGVAAALLVIIIVVIVYICLMRLKRIMRQTSESASSMPSPTVEMGRSNNSLQVNELCPYYAHNARQLTILELEQATRCFNQSNIVGEDRFGLVYQGLLQDGSIVAIKRRMSSLTTNFIGEVRKISCIHHMNLVKLIGYYEDGYQQLLVYEHLPNGHVGNHLYDSEGLPIGKLDLWRRLSIALGASKGLEHLHSLDPPLVHTNFRTQNVFLDGSYTAKVSDYGFGTLQREVDQAAASSSCIDCFLDPELSSPENYTQQSDVYSFGVFLLELISGCEVYNRNMSTLEENLVFQAKAKAKDSDGLEKLVDVTLGEHEKDGARRMVRLALLCISKSYRRPSMGQIVQELERIQREIAPFYSQVNEDIGVVTLGSELFQ
ncbi:probable serine/threonine-protein kinase PBL28 isoform X1 [Arachis ipaensis]|uniref:probable serine/threonine-protein kinase PBL28 isoform X1 n=1 Tax=Arachis ipaensis TaxID=130454 RepID=UPI0007AF0CE5|nr:probable serine/threonine-protein kinase PBL28 isoform X1 [Arachis ipaensis]XP_020964280.1 probable serine/threonine-protein kinase PBL28 isoform X1 [Arachis ipaensis]XP_020964281.1 probable serine/threonine-protein kinase PBL28 isoform X1 [Arachis ipaensis]XP_025674067.1 probable serine/threonine-protein kinase PBL28 isoform X1 [Arachis hypogaea]QHN95036.1 Putative LRR receptor-like serine/threonine-protein kinase [Arachis hypogaea]